MSIRGPSFYISPLLVRPSGLNSPPFATETLSMTPLDDTLVFIGNTGTFAVLALCSVSLPWTNAILGTKTSKILLCVSHDKDIGEF